MRKTVAVTMAIVVMSLVGMMFAANMALKPYQQYARIGRELTTILEMRRDIREGTTVFTLAKVATDKRLADDGWGMLIELSPSDKVKTKPGSMEKLAYRVAREAGDLYRQHGGRHAVATHIDHVHAQLVTAQGDHVEVVAGQLLAGVPPSEAVKYQIVIMFLIASVTGLGTVGAVLLSYLRLFNHRHQFLVDAITEAK